MELVAITADGTPVRRIEELPAIAWDVMQATAEMYRATGFHPPWVGYLALDGHRCVGTCAFKAVPVEGRVEIAYFTFPGDEGRGMATAMAQALVALARHHAPDVCIRAQTLPGPSASTRVLEKLGFRPVAQLWHAEDGFVWEWEIA